MDWMPLLLVHYRTGPTHGGADVLQEEQMSEAFIIGIDLAKRVFQIHGADAAGKVYTVES